MTTGAVEPTTDPAQRATEILHTIMMLAAEVALDLEMTYDDARLLFTTTLFERSEQRYKSAANSAAALATTQRTVQKFRRRRQEEAAASVFNMRRRVLHLLDRGPTDMDTIERALPPKSDVSYARSALRSLTKDGLVIKDKALGKYRRAHPDFHPWYLRAEVFPGPALELFFAHVARHFGSRFTPKLEEGSTPASMCAVLANIPADRLADYVEEFYRLMREFDERWRKIGADAPTNAPRVFAGAEAFFGRLGHAVEDDAMRTMTETAAGPLWDTTAWGESQA